MLNSHFEHLIELSSGEENIMYPSFVTFNFQSTKAKRDPLLSKYQFLRQTSAQYHIKKS